MKISALLLAIFKSLALYLELKVRSFYSDLVNQHYNRRKEIINEIEKLRDKPSSSNNDAADRLLFVLDEENKRFNDISTFYTEFRKADNNSDKGR